MASPITRYHESIDYSTLTAAYPPPPEFFEARYYEPPEAIERRQLIRLQAEVWRAWNVPFFRRRWTEAGFHPSQLKSLHDLTRIPTYTVEDIRRSVELVPPYGDYQGVAIEDASQMPLRIYWSGGTTGRSRPTLYTPWDREIGAITVARALYLQGIRPGDVVLNSWAYSTHNSAWIHDEALTKWLSCVPVTVSTGNVTATKRQLEIAREYRAASVLTTVDYLLHMTDVAHEVGWDLQNDFSFRTFPTIGMSERVEAEWNVPVYDNYGFHEVQYVAAECGARTGLHIWEDAFIIEIVDVDTGEPVSDGRDGNIVVTCLYKTGSPQIRYNMQDLSRLYPREQCQCGSWLRRMGHFMGRSDTMVKLRGVNVWPEAVGRIATADSRVGDEYFVRAFKRGVRDELMVQVESAAESAGGPAIVADIENHLKEQLGVKVLVELVPLGSLAQATGKGTSGKLRRFSG